MSIFQSFDTCVFKKYCDFKGRTSRKEFWGFWAVYILLTIGVTIFLWALLDFLYRGDLPTLSRLIYTLYVLIANIGLFCPFLAASIRRLHDAGLSGWNFLWFLVPYAGFIVFIVLMCRPTDLVGWEMRKNVLNNKY